jgi:diguanylate cyclase (GGDEF)-like protein
VNLNEGRPDGDDPEDGSTASSRGESLRSLASHDEALSWWTRRLASGDANNTDEVDEAGDSDDHLTLHAGEAAEPVAAEDAPDVGWESDPDGEVGDPMIWPAEPDPAWPSAPVGWSDPITSADGPRYWDRLLSSERARTQRYKRPATIVLLELVGLDILAQDAGAEMAEQALVRCGRALMQEVRSSDHAARIDPGRFAIYLPETTEIDAINFVERVRVAVEAALVRELARGTVRFGIGWASPADGDLDVALELAEQRLADELKLRD